MFWDGVDVHFFTTISPFDRQFLLPHSPACPIASITTADDRIAIAGDTVCSPIVEPFTEAKNIPTEP